MAGAFDLEMRLGKEIAKAVDKDNVVVFSSTKTNQLYALFKIEDKAGAVAGFGNGMYMVTTKDFKEKEGKE